MSITQHEIRDESQRQATTRRYKKHNIYAPAAAGRTCIVVAMRAMSPERTHAI